MATPTVNTHVPVTPGKYDPENEANFRRLVQSGLSTLQTAVGGAVAAASLPNSGVTAGTYGSGTQTPVIAVDAQGIITSASNVASGGGGGAVSSVFTRTGAVVATSGDYTVAQVTGAAPLASPALTGVPTAPTPLTADNSTTVATTAYVKNVTSGGYVDTSTNQSVSGVKTFINQIGVDSGFAYGVTDVNDTNLTVTIQNPFIVINSLTAARTITLPAISGTQMNFLVIDPKQLVTATNTISFIPNGAPSGDTINGASATTVGMNAAGQMVTLESDANGHWTMVTDNTGTSPYLPLSGGTMTGVVTLDGVRHTVTTVADANYTATAHDEIIIYTSLTATRTVTVPTASTVLGQCLMVIDGTASGNVSTTKQIAVAVTGGSGDAITPTGATTIVNSAGGSGFAVATATNLWTVSPSGVTGWQFAGNNTQPMNALYSFGQAITAANGLTVSKNFNLANVRSYYGTDVSTPYSLTTSLAPVQLLKSNATGDVAKITGGTFYFLINSAGGTGSVLVEDSSSNVIDVLWPGSCGIYADANAGGTNLPALKAVRSGLQGPLIDLTAQAAAVGPTTILTTQATNSPGGSGGPGLYRISWTAIVTTAATASSVLGGTGGFQVTYTDNDTGAATTPIAIPNAAATGNTTTTQLSGDVVVNAKASTAIQYQFGYTSTGATAMQYALHIRTEFLG